MRIPMRVVIHALAILVLLSSCGSRRFASSVAPANSDQSTSVAAARAGVERLKPGSPGPIVSGTLWPRPLSGIHDEQDAAKFEVPTNRNIAVTWKADALPGTHVAGFRWALDPKNVSGQNGRGKGGGWSGWGTIDQTNIEFAEPGVHSFYLEARDDAGGLTRVVALISALRPTPVTSR